MNHLQAQIALPVFREIFAGPVQSELDTSVLVLARKNRDM
jgi:hypothetical protein